MLRRSLTLICAVLFAVGALAQMPPAEPSKEMQAAAKMAGTWVGTLKMYGPGTETPMEVKCTMTYTPKLGGMFMESNVSYEIPGFGTMTGIEMFTYDAEAGLYRSWWYDATSATPMVFSGKMEGKTLTMTSEAKVVMGMEDPQVMRQVITHTSDTEIEFRLSMQMGNDWSPIFEGTFKKQ